MPPEPGTEAAWAECLVSKARALEGTLANEYGAEPPPPLYGVPIKTREFTGRSHELMRIHSALFPEHLGEQAAAVAVQTHGMGGIGKTELAIAYSRDFAQAFPAGIVWLNVAGWHAAGAAREDEAQVAWLRAVEQAFDLHPELLHRLTRDPDGKPIAPAAVRERLGAHLGQAKPYLLVLDNVPQLTPLDIRASILEFLRAPTYNGKVILTTRDARVAEGFTPLPLEVMGAEDALRVLARFRPQQAHAELDAMRALVNEVGAHTQALVLLGEHARDAVGGYPRLLEQLHAVGVVERIESIAAQLGAELGTKARGIVATFALSIEPLAEDEKELLGIASVCAPNEPIPDALLSVAFGGEAREDSFNSALRGLLRASLLQRRGETADTVQIHPLVANTAIQLLRVDVKHGETRLAAALLERLAVGDDVRSHAALFYDVAQARHFAPLRQDSGGVNLRILIGQYEYVRGEYSNAKRTAEAALAFARRVLGDEHPATVSSMNNLAVTLRAQGDLPGSRELEEEALSTSRRVFGERDATTLMSMNNQGKTLRTLGDLARARKLHQKALSVSRRVLGEENSCTLVSMNNLASTLRAQGDLKGARDLHQAALSIYRRVLGWEHNETLALMNNLAETLWALGDLDAARKLQEEALPIRRRLLGDEHPDTLALIKNHADMLSEQGDLTGARNHQEMALPICRRVLGEQHSITLMLMNGLANTLREQGDLEGARSLQEKALATCRSVLGEQDTITLMLMNDLACTLGKEGDLVNTRALEEELLSTRRRLLGEKHPDTLMSMHNLATTLWQLRAREDAAALMEASARGRLGKLGPQHPHTKLSMNALAHMRSVQK